MTPQAKQKSPSRIEIERGAWAERIEASMRGVDAELARLAGPEDAETMRALRLVRLALEHGATALGELPH